MVKNKNYGEGFKASKKWLRDSRINCIEFFALFTSNNAREHGLLHSSLERIACCFTKSRVSGHKIIVRLSQKRRRSRFMYSVYTLRAREGDPYVLRPSFLHMTGVESVADRRNGSIVVLATCHKALQKLGMLTNEADCRRAIYDRLKSSLRPLNRRFALFTSHWQRPNPKQLFFDYKDISVSNFQMGFQSSPELQNKELTLYHIYGKIQQRPAASLYYTNKQFGILSADKDVLALLYLTLEERQTEFLQKSEEAIT